MTGAAGQVGWELLRTLPALGEVVGVDLAEMDMSDPRQIRETLTLLAPDVVINAAAYTAVDRAESEVEAARIVNAEAPAVMAEVLRSRGGLLVHYSTDYVFDGTKIGAYVEDDPVNPLSVYGRTKLEGEKAVSASGVDHLIFRTSWVYTDRGKNFLLTMLRLFEERDELRIVDDQVGAPTWACWLAQATTEALRKWLNAGKDVAREATGTYHMTAGGATSWYGFARAIHARRYGANPGHGPRLIPISSAEYPVPARRPANSVLSNAKLKQRFGIPQRPWEEMLAEVMTPSPQPSPARGEGGSLRSREH